MLNIYSKTFEELDTTELYAILQLRSEIFVVEQECVYQDLDKKDKKALHIIGTKNGEIVAYTRAFKPNDYLEEACIGRVAVQMNERKYGYGRAIMKASIAIIEEKFKETTIALSAQTYLIKFYESLGFKTVGAEFLEDGIPHIKMIKKD